MHWNTTKGKNNKDEKRIICIKNHAKVFDELYTTKRLHSKLVWHFTRRGNN